MANSENKKIIIRGKRKWWTLWLTRYPDHEESELSQKLENALAQRDEQIQNLFFNSSKISDVMRRSKERDG
jgi:hypothetical protein